MAVWLLAVVLAVTMTMPGASYAVTASTPDGVQARTVAALVDEPRANNSAAQDPANQDPSVNDPVAQEPATQETAEDLLDRGLEDETQPDPQPDPQVESESEPAMRAESEPAPEPEPEPEPEPQYFSVYRIEVDDSGVMRCWWYDADGVKSEEPQKDAYFIVTFDKGSTTAGSAVVKVGKTGTLYYFNKNGKGKKYTGWFKQSGSKYYFKKGSRYLGTKKVKKTWYQFSKKNGKMIRRIGDGVDKKVQPYTSKTRYMIIVKLKEHRVRIYKGKKNAWKRVHKFKCTTGKSSTPTVRGTFTVGSKGLYFNTGNTLRCWYYTQFCGNYLFHSVIYDRSSKPKHVVDGRLGISASHGCVRLALKNAKWIYNNIPRGTKAVVY